MNGICYIAHEISNAVEIVERDDETVKGLSDIPSGIPSKETSKRSKTLPHTGVVMAWDQSPAAQWSWSFDNPHLAVGSDSSQPIFISPPLIQPIARNDYFGNIPRSTSPPELDGGHGTTTSSESLFPSTSTLKPQQRDVPFTSEIDIVDVSEDAELDSMRDFLPESHKFASIPEYPFIFPSSSSPLPVRATPWLDHHQQSHDISSTMDVMAKDPKALLDTESLTTDGSPPMDPSTVATALIAALGLLTSHSSSPKVIAFQLSAAVISFTLIALYTFHSRTLVAMEQHSKHLTTIQQLVKYFPLLIFASSWVLFLLSVTFTSPKVMAVTVFLAVFASIPMVFGARLPAILTLVIITLFGLAFFALVFLVCLVPTEWLT